MKAAGCYETRHSRDDALPTHRHARAYAALVLDGAHVENGVEGAFECVPGTLLLHPAFHAHGNRFGRHGARVVNIVLQDHAAPDALRVLRVPRLAEARETFLRQPSGLPALIQASEVSAPVETPEWQARLLHDLARTDAPIGQLCRDLGVSPAHASRTLARSHGMPPQLLRRELRWRLAMELLQGDASLAEVALRSGFADQSHLSRVARAYAGVTLTELRRRIKSVQDPGSGGGHQ